MKESSQVIMGATLIMAASLAIVLGLVFVLLAELYCSLLLRRCRRHRSHHHQQLCNPAASSVTILSATSATIPSPSLNPSPTPSPLSSFYAHGVLHAPRSLLFPALRSPSAPAKHYLLHDEASSPLNVIPLSLPSPAIKEESPYRFEPRTSDHHLVYISNPIYDNDAANAPNGQLPDTPFETPCSSPSRHDSVSSSGESNTPPLTPMKKLPAEACSVPLRDVGSLCTSRSDSNTNHGILSSSSGTPCTSPSW